MIVSAVVTGNTICCKPSSDAPIVAYKFVELCQKAGIPADVVSYIPGSGSEIGDFIVEHPLTRFVNFTGSKAVGCRINEHAAKIADGQRWIKRVVAEMGGKNAIIVDSTADIKKAARTGPKISSLAILASLLISLTGRDGSNVLWLRWVERMQLS